MLRVGIAGLRSSFRLFSSAANTASVAPNHDSRFVLNRSIRCCASPTDLFRLLSQSDRANLDVVNLCTSLSQFSSFAFPTRDDSRCLSLLNDIDARLQSEPNAWKHNNVAECALIVSRLVSNRAVSFHSVQRTLEVLVAWIRDHGVDGFSLSRVHALIQAFSSISFKCLSISQQLLSRIADSPQQKDSQVISRFIRLNSTMSASESVSLTEQLSPSLTSSSASTQPIPQSISQLKRGLHACSNVAAIVQYYSKRRSDFDSPERLALLLSALCRFNQPAVLIDSNIVNDISKSLTHSSALWTTSDSIALMKALVQFKIVDSKQVVVLVDAIVHMLSTHGVAKFDGRVLVLVQCFVALKVPCVSIASSILKHLNSQLSSDLVSKSHVQSLLNSFRRLNQLHVPSPSQSRDTVPAPFDESAAFNTFSAFCQSSSQYPIPEAVAQFRAYCAQHSNSTVCDPRILDVISTLIASMTSRADWTISSVSHTINAIAVLCQRNQLPESSVTSVVDGVSAWLFKHGLHGASATDVIDLLHAFSQLRIQHKILFDSASQFLLRTDFSSLDESQIAKLAVAAAAQTSLVRPELIAMIQHCVQQRGQSVEHNTQQRISAALKQLQSSYQL
jgi:hypothetical protein